MLNITNHQDMQIKTTMSYHLTSVRMAIINKTTNIGCWQGHQRKEKSSTLLMEM